jgi:putative hydrolase of the HAD superfamily
MIKAVLFDFGGVLSESGKAGAIRNIFAKSYNVSPESLRSDKSGLMALKGQMSDDEFISDMNRRHTSGRPVSKEVFEATVDHFAPSGPVYDLAKSLREQSIRTGILSNTLSVAAESLRSKGMYEGFDPVLLSCETNMAKPELEYYQLAIDRLGVKPEEIIFVDDQSICLEPAKVLGMKTVLAENPEQIVRGVNKLIENENGVSL